MRALVVYESMFGNTRLVAEAVAEGLRVGGDATSVPVSEAGAADLAGMDLLVVGGPTHAHGMSRPSTRKAAAEMAGKPDSGLALEPHAVGPGLREWLSDLGDGDAAAAAFDTRMPMAPLLTGRASRRIHRFLRRHGYRVAAPPQSFLVDKRSRLLDGELDRARAWGESLASQVLKGARAGTGA